jgi:hypothetical protein
MRAEQEAALSASLLHPAENVYCTARPEKHIKRKATRHDWLHSLPPPGVKDKESKLRYGEEITINVPLLKKLRDIIFFLRDNNFLSHFEGHFEAPSKCPEKWLKKLWSQKKTFCPKVS